MQLELIDRPSSGVAAATLLLVSVFTGGCSREAPAPGAPATSAATEAPASPAASDRPAANPERNAYFGDVHVHTGWSFDAFTNGSRATPTDAYAWAQGQEITNSGMGGKIQIQTPLDFYMVADHAEFMGVFNQMSNPDSPLSKTELAKGVNSPDPVVRMQTFAGILRDMSAGKVDPMLTDPALARSVWAEIVKAADAAYRPGHFTTFAGFEWTANPQKRNLHRVVVFRDTAKLPDMVLSALESEDPETLWKWMDELRAQGSTLLAIPHNGNASDGRMFETVSSTASRSTPPITRRAPGTNRSTRSRRSRARPRRTPTSRPTTSSPASSSGTTRFRPTTSGPSTAAAASPARRCSTACRRKRRATATRSSTASSATPTRTTPRPATRSSTTPASSPSRTTPAHRLKGMEGQPAGQVRQVQEFSSGGLAGVWAEENTRESIFDAMQRRETFGTSGTMIKVRFFGGWDFTDADLKGAGAVQAGYARGVPMGGDLKAAAGKAPSFVVAASKDPKSGNLDRVQIVKGWLDAQRQAAREGLRRRVERRSQA